MRELFVCTKLVPVKSESVKFAPVRSAPVRFAPVRFAPVRFAPYRFAPFRFASILRLCWLFWKIHINEFMRSMIFHAIKRMKTTTLKN